MKDVLYYDKEKKIVKKEKIPGSLWLKYLYYNPYGVLTLNLLIKRKIISKIVGTLTDLPISKYKIKSFVKKHNINMNEFKYPIEHYKTFNHFFYRKLKKNTRVINCSQNSFISPADGKIFCIENIDKYTDFYIKGSKFNLTKLIKTDSEKFINGTAIIIRLSPTDYHRFHFPIDAKIMNNYKIDGNLFSVSPLSLRVFPDIFWKNKRHITKMRNKIIGDFLFIEVGATIVGSIINTNKKIHVLKGEEKGYFKFGGSTIILIFKKNKIILNKNIIKQNKKFREVKIKFGEKIGELI